MNKDGKKKYDSWMVSLKEARDPMKPTKRANLEGLYRALGVPNGAVDIFMEHFVARSGEYDVRKWAKSHLSSVNVPEAIQTAAVEYDWMSKSGEQKAIRGLLVGWTYWWKLILGNNHVEHLVKFTVSLWEKEMSEEIESGRKEGIKELRYLTDNLESFFNDSVATRATTGTGQYKDVEPGLLGRLADWHIGLKEGVFDQFLGAMRESVDRLGSKYSDQLANTPAISPDPIRQDTGPSREHPLAKFARDNWNQDGES
tara:strand:+ start:6397 stop:7164 length:768 start_codon:yes stop_codon:yes gene_type:complete